jgi:hypothetical protein
VKPLPLRPLPIPTEPLADFLERLGSANGYQGNELWQILDKDMIPDVQVLTNALNGHSLPTFSGPSVVDIEIPVELFGLQSVDFIHRHRRWCPICVRESAWFRPVWRLKVATICHAHGVRFLQSCPKCRAYPDTQSILKGICECGARFAHAPGPANRQEILIGSALVESLTQIASLSLEEETVIELDSAQLVRLICYVGRFVEGPNLSRPGKIRELEDLQVAARLVSGTATLIADWPTAFWHCLEQFVEAAPHDASVRRVFGPLYHVLYKDLRDPAFQFLRDAFELFLLEHWRGELCGRHRLFHVETREDHRYKGIARVARASGLSGKLLRRMVHEDRIPANRLKQTPKRTIITIDSVKLSKFVPNRSAYLDLQKAANFLGLKRSRLRQLVAHGVILADVRPDWGRENQWYFRRQELNKLVDELRATAASSPATQNMLSIKQILKYWRVLPAEFGSLLRSCKASQLPYSWSKDGRLCDIVLDYDEARRWLDQTRQEIREWVSVAKAAELLNLKEQVVYELVAKNLLIADLISKSGRTIRRIYLSSLHEFKQTYVSLAEIARIEKVPPPALLKRLTVKPIIGPRVDGGRQYFYRRSDLQNDDLRRAEGNG